MTVYEGMFILDSTKYSRDPDTVTGQLNDLVTEHGGTVLVSQLWDCLLYTSDAADEV